MNPAEKILKEACGIPAGTAIQPKPQLLLKDILKAMENYRTAHPITYGYKEVLGKDLKEGDKYWRNGCIITVSTYEYEYQSQRNNQNKYLVLTEITPKPSFEEWYKDVEVREHNIMYKDGKEIKPKDIYEAGQRSMSIPELSDAEIDALYPLPELGGYLYDRRTDLRKGAKSYRDWLSEQTNK